MKSMKDLSKEERPAFGQKVNELETDDRPAAIEEKTCGLGRKKNDRLQREKIDITLDGRKPNLGNIHPLTLVQKEENRGSFYRFRLQRGGRPGSRTGFFNFERANIPKDHPARDMQDTFYIDVEHLLRTHTTAIRCVLAKRCTADTDQGHLPGQRYIAAMTMMQRILTRLHRWKVSLSARISV